MARTAKQRAAQLKAAKASALARKKKALRGQVAYADKQGLNGKTSRTYTRADYSSGPSLGKARPGLDKPKVIQSKSRGAPMIVPSNSRRTAVRKIEATGLRANNIAIHQINHTIGMRKPK